MKLFQRVWSLSRFKTIQTARENVLIPIQSHEFGKEETAHKTVLYVTFSINFLFMRVEVLTVFRKKMSSFSNKRKTNLT